MDSKLEDLLIILADDIDKKCFELNQHKRELKNTRLFILTCILFITIPIILMFMEISILNIFIPIVFIIAYAMFILSPIVLDNNLGGTYNERFEHDI